MPARRKFKARHYNKSWNDYMKSKAYQYWKRKYLRNQKLGRHLFKLRGVFTLSADAGGQNQDVLSLTNPGAYLNMASSLPDLGNLTPLFDNLRICAVKVKYIPLAPNNVSGATSFVPLYIVNDFDDETALTSVSDAVQYEKCHVVDLAKPWKHYVKVPKTGSTTANTVGYGWFDIATVPNSAGIKFYSLGLTNLFNYGTVVATYYVAFKNRR